MKSFKEFLDEETTAGDIAPVDNKLNTKSQSRKCVKHNKLDCPECKGTE